MWLVVCGDMDMTKWTVGDMAELAELAMDIATEERYCESCGVVAVQDGDKYCDGCANSIAEWLYAAYWDQRAEEYMEVLRTEEGWY